MIEPTEAEAIGRAMLMDGREIEEVLASWRERDLSILHSIQCLSHIAGMTLGEAKEVVHMSKAWSDSRPQNEKLHEQLEAFAKRHGSS